MRFVRTNNFERDYKRLPQPIKEAFAKQFLLFLETPSHPSLDIKKMKGHADLWRVKLTAGYRFTFQRVGDAIVLRRIGPHDIERNP